VSEGGARVSPKNGRAPPRAGVTRVAAGSARRRNSDVARGGFRSGSTAAGGARGRTSPSGEIERNSISSNFAVVVARFASSLSRRVSPAARPRARGGAHHAGAGADGMPPSPGACTAEQERWRSIAPAAPVVASGPAGRLRVAPRAIGYNLEFTVRRSGER